MENYPTLWDFSAPLDMLFISSTHPFAHAMQSHDL